MMMHWGEQSFIACLASFKQVIYGLINYRREDAPIWVVVRFSVLKRESESDGKLKALNEHFISLSVFQHTMHVDANTAPGTFIETDVISGPLIIITDKSGSSVSDRQVLVAGWLPYPKKKAHNRGVMGHCQHTRQASSSSSRQIINLTYTLAHSSLCRERQCCQIHQDSTLKWSTVAGDTSEREKRKWCEIWETD